MWNTRGNRSTLARDLNKKSCNCKNSRCLKLYCECFASGRYCDACNCNNCCNNRENEGTRRAAVEAILDRNPNAFRPKIQGGINEDGLAAAPSARHNKGCNCKKSGCLKKYCECFQAGIFCSDNCKCAECKNYEGSAARDHMLGTMGLGVLAMLRPPSPPMGALAGPLPVPPPLTGPLRRASSGQGNSPYGSLDSPVGPPSLPGPFKRNRGRASGGAGRASGPLEPLPIVKGRALVKSVVEEISRNGGVNQVADLLCMVAKEAKDRYTQEQETTDRPQDRQPDRQMDGQQDAHVAMQQDTQDTQDVAQHQQDFVAGPSGREHGAEPGAAPSSPRARSTSVLYEQQEHAVLQEFNDVLQRIVNKMNMRLQQQQQQELYRSISEGVRPPGSLSGPLTGPLPSPAATPQLPVSGPNSAPAPQGMWGPLAGPFPGPMLGGPRPNAMQPPAHLANLMAQTGARPNSSNALPPATGQANGTGSQPQQLVVGPGSTLSGHTLQQVAAGQLALTGQGGTPLQMVQLQQLGQNGMPQNQHFVMRKGVPVPGQGPPLSSGPSSVYIGSVQQMQAHAVMANVMRQQQQQSMQPNTTAMQHMQQQFAGQQPPQQAQPQASSLDGLPSGGPQGPSQMMAQPVGGPVGDPGMHLHATDSLAGVGDMKNDVVPMEQG